MMEYTFIKTEHKEGIGILTFNRPDKLNAMTQLFFRELASAVDEFDKNDDIVVVIVHGEGKAFSAGLDFHDFLQNFVENRKQKKTDEDFLRDNVMFMQDSISAIEKSKKVYIAAIHGYCIGGGLDLASTCDIRIASKDAVFAIMETKLGVVADLGSIQRLPRIIGEGNTRLLAYTARKINAEEALSIGLISKIYDNKEEVLQGALELAKEMLTNPKEAIIGTKIAMTYGLSHSIDESLIFAARYNAKIFDFDKVKARFLNNIKK